MYLRNFSSFVFVSVLLFVFVLGFSTSLNDKQLCDELNILFLTIDSLRPDKLSCYYYGKRTSPNIDRLCDEGLVFLNAYASSGWTSPSLVSIFSSLLPTTHGVEVRGFVLNSRMKTPVELISEKGWKAYGQHASGDTIGNLGFLPAGGTLEEFLEKVRNEKFFVWYHLRTPHLPYNPPQRYIVEFGGSVTVSIDKIKPLMEKKMIVKGVEEMELTEHEREFVRTLYEADVRAQDDEIGLIVEKLRQLGLWKKTVIVLTSDHGEELFEHGWVGHASTSLDGHLYTEILKIPLIIRLPGLKRRIDVQTPVSHIDIMPMLFGILGLKPDFLTDSDVAEVRLDLTKGSFEVRRRTNVIFSSTSPCGWQCKENEKWKRIYAIQEGNWKLVYYNYDGDRVQDRFELFHLPNESENVVVQNVQRFHYMVDKMFQVLSNSKKKKLLFPPETF